MYFIDHKYFNYIKKSKLLKKIDKAEIIAAFCRLNTLTSIKIAGSGHIGTSMSAMDLFVWINHFMIKKNRKNLNRDIFFSSKGHDVPGLYNVLYSLGIINKSKIFKLRKINGLDGHPDVSVSGIEANTGSLGMGISKAKGMALGKKLTNSKGKIIVLTGDGEFQEGQIYESLQTASAQKINDLIVVIDHNKIQSSRYVKDIININPLEKKIKSFGWYVNRCDGNSMKEISKAFKKMYQVNSKPKLLIADTIKGKGIKSIEHPQFMKNYKVYNWHSGAPNNSEYNSMTMELLNSIKKLLKKNNIKTDFIKSIYRFNNTNQNSIDIH